MRLLASDFGTKQILQRYLVDYLSHCSFWGGDSRMERYLAFLITLTGASSFHSVKVSLE